MEPRHFRHPTQRAARAVLWLSIAAMCTLTFVWPFAVSAEPDQPAFKAAAIASLLLFLGALLALLAGRITAER